MLENIKIIHLTSVHPRHDVRIFVKMCSSLAKEYYNVTLVVADGNGDEKKNEVSIIDLGKRKTGRFSRMTKTVSSIFKKAKELDGDIYHLHDPELIPIGLKLMKLGKKVIFDAHEDLSKQLLSKTYLSKSLKIILSKIFEWYQQRTLSKFDYVIAATPYICDKFLKVNPKIININNFPRIEEAINTCVWKKKKNEVAYVGGISKKRGIEEIISALSYTKKIRLNLAGTFNDNAFEKQIKKLPQWERVNELGFLNRKHINEVLSNSIAGLVTLYPTLNYIDALPVKMFEYMNAGIPVIASNFPLWSEIVEGNNCGICVDPKNSRAIGDAIQYLIDNPLEAEQMGKNGLQAVRQKYNWTKEEKKLLKIYKDI